MISVKGKIVGCEKFEGKRGNYYKYQIQNNINTKRGNRVENLFVKTKQNGHKVGEEVTFSNCILVPWVGRQGVAYVDIWAME